MIAVDVWGYFHPDVAVYLNNLGGILEVTRNYTEALRYHHLALQIQEQVLGPNNLAVAQTLNNLGAIYARLDDHELAEQHYLRALRIRVQHLPPAHPELAITRNNLARLYAEALGDIIRAESLFQDALADRCQALGDYHPDVAESLFDLAQLYRGIGNYAKAQKFSHQALRVLRAALGKNHPRTAIVLQQLSSLAMVADRPTRAFKLVQIASAIEERVCGDLLNFASERQRLVLVNAIRGNLFQDLSIIREAFISVPSAVKWALELVWRRKAVSAEALAVQRDAILGGHYPALQPRVRELIALQAQIARKSLDGPGAEDLQTYRQTLKRDLMAQAHQFLGQIRHDTFGAPVELRRH